MRTALILIIGMMVSTIIFAQDKNDASAIVYEDKIYKDYIGAVKFNVAGADLSLPMLDLTDGQLYLTFDDLDADVKYFYYTIIHCDKDWKASTDLSEMDYIDGFTEEEIDDHDFSTNTLQPYTNFELYLPNQDMKWKISGNYALKIYTDDGPDDIVLTRRFIVVDSKVNIIPQVTRAVEAGKMRTHQEIDFVVDHEGFSIPNPKQEISVTILQNGMWKNMKTNVQPLFVKTERLEYDYQGKIVFPGLREYRHLDMRSFQYRTDRVREIYQNDDGTDLDLIGERIRTDLPYLFEIDMNGNYIIDNIHEDDDNIEADYALVNFYLSKRFPFEKGSIYVFGKMTDWRLQDGFKMEFNEKIKAYETSAYMKQGFYNYLFAYVPDGTTEIDFEELEGNTHEAENDYTIIVYYRPFGGRYDQVIAANTFNSIR
jgi:hypothetical protein